MSAAQMLIEDGLLKGDLDAGGFKILNLDISNLGEFTNQVPFADSQAIIKGSVDPTKLARFEVDGFTTATTRVFTLPNYNAQLASLAGTEAFTNKTLNGLTFSGSGGGIELNSGIISISDGTLVLDGDVTISGSGASLTLLLTGNTNLTLPTSGIVAVTSQIPVISDVAYNEATWNGNLDGATKNAIRDKFESLTTATTQPFSDATALIKGSANSLKQFRIEVDQLSTGIRVMTPPDYDFIPASIAGEEALIKKTVNGLTVNVGDAASAGGAVTYDETPSSPFLLNLVAISQSGTTCVLRTTAPTDIVLPVTGTVATVALTIPMSYLSVNKDLGGGLASDVKVPTQLAIRTYVDSHTGAGKQAVSGDTVASATSVDLSATTDYQLDVSGTTDIEQFIIDEDEERVVVFDDDLTLIHSATLLLPGSENISVAEGDYAVVRGQAGGVTALLEMVKASLAPTSKVADFDGGSIKRLTYLGVLGSGGQNFDLRLTCDDVFTANRHLRFTVGDEDREVGIYGDVTFAGDFLLFGGFGTTLTVTGLTSVTLPTTGTVEAFVGVPASAAAAGIAGQKAYDASFEYRCISSGNWVRNAHSTWP